MADTLLAPVADKPAPSRPAPRPGSGRTAGAARWARRGVVIAYVGILVLVPVITLIDKALSPGWSQFTATLRDPQTTHAFELTGIVAGWAVLINTVFGVIVAILLVRYRFPGRRLLSAFVDLPVAVSPIVVGLALILVYGPTGWFGSVVHSQVINAQPGMVLATAFVSLPLVVRAVEPVLEQAGIEQDQAAASLGANAAQRFWRITLPSIRIALAYGVVLCLARCIGEYGAVLVVSGNVEGRTETAPLRIGNLAENFATNQAYAITFVLMVIAFAAIVLGALIRRRAELSLRPTRPAVRRSRRATPQQQSEGAA